ncbi:MAG: prenyltransferase [Thaumarchaeota archaeon]|nr:prenyltransferase [Nitrososphaerota archaeon]
MPSVWVKELRAPFLLLPTIFVPVGVAIAWNHGAFDPLVALMTLVGVLCLHVSVNVLNDYFDFRSGLDLATIPTPFSGGSRVLPTKELRPESVLYAGILFLGIGLAIGSYFVFRFAFDPILVGIVVIAAVSIVAYSAVLSRVGIGELMAGLNFGPLLIIGTYYLQRGRIDLEPVLVGISLGILVSAILYINEFPDAVADEGVGRRHLIVRWGKAKAATRFKVLVASAYLVIITGVIVGIVTPLALLSLVALPKAGAAASILGRNYDKTTELIPGMASMVLATIWTGLLLLVGYLVRGFIF